MSFFDVVIVQPIFNLLMAIYGLIPDFGISVVIFTIIVRLALWPLVKKQLRQAKAMRKMQPELAKLKVKYKNNRQMQSVAMLELYKKHNVSLFGSMAILLIQLPILFGIYRVVQLFVLHRDQLGQYTYDVLEHVPVVRQLIQHPETFNQNFLGMIDLTKQAVSQHGTEVALVLLALAAAVLQFFLSKQLSPNSDSKRRLRDVLAEAGQGKDADQAEVNAIMMRKMMKVLPVMLFFIMISLPGALALYLATANAAAYIQNAIIMKQYGDDEPAAPTKAAPAKSAAKRASSAKEARITRIKAKE